MHICNPRTFMDRWKVETGDSSKLPISNKRVTASKWMARTDSGKLSSDLQTHAPTWVEFKGWRSVEDHLPSTHKRLPNPQRAFLTPAFRALKSPFQPPPQPVLSGIRAVFVPRLSARLPTGVRPKSSGNVRKHKEQAQHSQFSPIRKNLPVVSVRAAIMEQ